MRGEVCPKYRTGRHESLDAAWRDYGEVIGLTVAVGLESLPCGIAISRVRRDDHVLECSRGVRRVTGKRLERGRVRLGHDSILIGPEASLLEAVLVAS
eukprot:scaffold4502_cov119-Isochrysis_galbana.AAC.7